MFLANSVHVRCACSAVLTENLSDNYLLIKGLIAILLSLLLKNFVGSSHQGNLFIGNDAIINNGNYLLVSLI